MAKPWREVEANPAFQALPEADREAARQEYFASVVAPKVPEADLELARKQFDDDTLKRSLGGAIRDYGLSALQSAATLAEGATGIVDLATAVSPQAMLTRAAGIEVPKVGDQVRFDETREIISGAKTPYSQAGAKEVADAEGFMGTLGALKDNPDQAAQLMVENIALFLPGAAGARISSASAYKGALETAMRAGIPQAQAKVIAAKAAAKAGTAAVLGAEAGIGGSFAGAQAVDELEAVRPDATEAEKDAARVAGAGLGAITSAATARLAGTAAATQRAFGIGDEGAKTALGKVAAGTSVAAREIGQEGAQEGYEDLSAKRGASIVDENVPLADENTPKNIAMGLAIGAGPGAVSGIATATKDGSQAAYIDRLVEVTDRLGRAKMNPNLAELIGRETAMATAGKTLTTDDIIAALNRVPDAAISALSPNYKQLRTAGASEQDAKLIVGKLISEGVQLEPTTPPATAAPAAPRGRIEPTLEPASPPVVDQPVGDASTAVPATPPPAAPPVAPPTDIDAEIADVFAQDEAPLAAPAPAVETTDAAPPPPLPMTAPTVQPEAGSPAPPAQDSPEGEIIPPDVAPAPAAAEVSPPAGDVAPTPQPAVEGEAGGAEQEAPAIPEAPAPAAPAAQKMSMDEFKAAFEKRKAENDAKREAIRETVKDESAELVSKTGQRGLITRDTIDPTKFRITTFDGAEPTGHIQTRSIDEAIEEAVKMGYKPKEQAAAPAPEAPAPAKAEPAEKPKPPRKPKPEDALVAQAVADFDLNEVDALAAVKKLKAEGVIRKNKDTGELEITDRRKWKQKNLLKAAGYKLKRPYKPRPRKPAKTAKEFAAHRRADLIKEIEARGGITMDERLDITGEGTLRSDPNYRDAPKLVTKDGGTALRLFRKGGMTIDEVADVLRDMGYLPPIDMESVDSTDYDEVRDLIRALTDGRVEDLVPPNDRPEYEAMLAEEQAAWEKAQEAEGLAEADRDDTLIQYEADQVLSQDEIEALFQKYDDDDAAYFAALQEAIDAQRADAENQERGSDDGEAEREPGSDDDIEEVPAGERRESDEAQDEAAGFALEAEEDGKAPATKPRALRPDERPENFQLTQPQKSEEVAEDEAKRDVTARQGMGLFSATGDVRDEAKGDAKLSFAPDPSSIDGKLAAAEQVLLTGNRIQAKLRKAKLTGARGLYLKGMARVTKTLFNREVVLYEATSEGTTPEGFVLPRYPDTIFIKADTWRLPRFVLGHELLHTLRLQDEALYNEIVGNLRDVIDDYPYYKELFDLRYKQFGRAPLSEESVREEFIADTLGALFLEPGFPFELAARMGKGKYERMALKLLAILDKIIARIRRWRGVQKSDSVSDRHMQRFILDAEAAKQAVKDAMENAVARRGEFTGDGSARMSFDPAPKTGTPEFKRWFGDSKVVDAEGKPLVVYHGTGKEFGPVFKTEPERTGSFDLDGIGAWFAESPKLSNEVIQYYGKATKRGAPQPASIPAFIAIRKPLEIQSRRLMNSALLTHGASNGTDAAMAVMREKMKSDPAAAAREIKDRLIAAGYDGLHILNDSGFGPAWVAFSPEQIKSAIGNRGTFDPAKPSILESVLPQPDPTSIKNAETTRQRLIRGMPAPVQAATRAWGPLWTQNEPQNASDWFAIETLVKDLAAKPRPISDVEDIQLLYQQIRLQNQADKLNEQIQEAYQTGDGSDIARLFLQRNHIEDALLELYEVNKSVGTETGRGLAARKIMAAQDFTLVNMINQARSIKQGRRLLPEEEEYVRKLQARIAKLEEQLRERGEEADTKQAYEDAFAQYQADAFGADPNLPANQPQARKGRAKDITKQIRDAVANGEDIADYAGLLQRLARAFVEMGVRDRNVLIQKVGDFLRGLGVTVNDRELMDAISGYGKFSPLSKDEVSVELRRMKGEMQQVGKLQDMLAGRPPQKTGVERRTPGDEERELIRQVNEMKKRLNIQSLDPERSLKSALDTIKTRLKNQIRDYERAIEKGERINATKSPAPNDPEVERLKKLRDAVKEQYETLFPKNDRALTDEQRARMAEASLERSIAQYEQAIKDGSLEPFQRSSTQPLDNPKLTALRARRDAIKAELQQLRDASVAIQEQKQLKQMSAAMTQMYEKLVNGDLLPKKSNTISTAAIEAMRANQRRLAAALKEARNDAGVFDQQKLQQAIDAAQKSIEEYSRRISMGDFFGRAKPGKVIKDPQLDLLRAHRDDLAKLYQRLKRAQEPKRTKEEIDLQRLKTRLANEIAQFREKIANNDFEKKVPSKVKQDAEADALRLQRDALHREWHEKRMQWRIDQWTGAQKWWYRTKELMGLPRAFLTMLDFSAVLRQGGFLVYGDPRRAFKPAADMLKGLRSEAERQRLTDEIRRRPNSVSGLYKQAGLYIAEQGVNLSQREEVYMNRWIEKIPIPILGAAVRAAYQGSERAYTVFLNRLRADTFDALIATMTATGTPTEMEAKAIAKFVNNATGRGSVFGSDQGAEVASQIFFSPRYLTSRFALIGSVPAGAIAGAFSGKTRRASLAIGMEYVKFGIAVGLFYGMLMLAMDDDEEDKMLGKSALSSDFGKIIAGDTRIDPLFGMSQVLVLANRLWRGKTETLAGKVVDTYGEDAAFGKSGGNILGSFIRSKIAPTPGLMYDYLVTGKDFQGEPVITGDYVTDAARLAKESLTPMSVQTIMEIGSEHDVPETAALTGLALLGVGVSVYK